MNAEEKKRIRKISLAILFAALIIFSSLFVYLIRTGKKDPAFPGTESYKNLISDSQNSLFGVITGAAGNELYLFILGIIFNLLTVFVLNKILEALKIKNDTRIMALLIFLVTPMFIYSSSVISADSLISLLAVASAYFLLKKKFAVSAIITSALSLFNIYVFLAAMIMTFILSLRTRGLKRWLRIAPLPAAACLFSIFAFRLEIFENIEHPALTNLFADFGAFTGYSLFITLIAFIEILFLFEKKKTASFIIPLLAGFAASLYIPGLRLVLNIIFSVFAAAGIRRIFNRIWSWDFLKQVTALIVVCTIVFSAVAFASLLAKSEPTKFLAGSLGYIKKRDNSYSVASHPDNQVYIQYFSSHPTVGQGSDLNLLFRSASLNDTESVLEKYDIGYILITPEMRKGKVWAENNEGLLLVMQNSGEFANIYSANDYEVWAYMNREEII